MPLYRSCRIGTTVSFAAGILFLAGGCERSRPAAQADSASVQPRRSTLGVKDVVSGSNWNRLAGYALLVRGDSREEAIVLLPAEGDSAVAEDIRALDDPKAKVALFGRGGQQQFVKLGMLPSTSDAECRVWPLTGLQSESPGAMWAVGFVGGQASPLVLDSVDVLTSRDSMALAAEASRLASTVTASTAASFQGLRFTAHDIRRFEASPGVQAIVAHLIRKVNQEARPQEEQTLLIAERDSGATTGPYRLAYADRTYGLEEELATPEVLAGVRIAGRVVLIIARDSDDGIAYVMLERGGHGQWKVRWTSAMTRCG